MRRRTARTVGLIAAREIRSRQRSRAFVLITVVTAVALAGFAVIIGIVKGGGSELHVAVPTGQRQELRPILTGAARGLGTPVTVRAVPGAAQGRRDVAKGDADAYVAGGTDGRLRVVVKRDVDAQLEPVLRLAARQRVLTGQIEDLGGDPAEVSAAVARARVQIAPLSPPRSYDPQRLVLGIVAGVLIYLALLIGGQTVAQGVVEEKSTRVVELLLATVHPWQLMAGKVLGLGAVGLVQVLVIGGSGTVAGIVSGSLDLPGSAAAGIVGWLLVWFLLGYAAYAFVFAGLGALVSRQEDVAGVVTPVTMVLIVGYLVGASVLPSNPGNSVVAALSVTPPFSPTLMPIRLAIGGVPAWQTGLALVLITATIPLLVAVCARVYRNAVVRSGVRVRMVDAVRGR